MSHSPLKPVRMILESSGDLEWARLVGAGGPPLRPPLLAWRFKTPDPVIEGRLVHAVESYAGTTDWCVRKEGRNWVLRMRAFLEFARGFGSDVDASERFGVEYPAETATAHSDASALAEHIRELMPRR